MIHFQTKIVVGLGSGKVRGPFTCQECGIEYFTRRQKGEGEKFHSRECAFKYRVGPNQVGWLPAEKRKSYKPPKPCIICRKPTKYRLCSEACRKQRARDYDAKAYHGFVPSLESVICILCSADIRVYPYRPPVCPKCKRKYYHRIKGKLLPGSFRNTPKEFISEVIQVHKENQAWDKLVKYIATQRKQLKQRGITSNGFED
jgi:hypothetical protein